MVSYLKIYFTAFVLSVCNEAINAQNNNEPMQALSFLVGDWVGVSKQFSNDSIVSEVPAHQQVQYKVNGHILTIDLQSSTLNLHTVIYYDSEAENYSYNPFYEGGTGSYPASLEEGKLIVTPNDSRRFIFHVLDNGNFREYGEKLENGSWVKYFEDTYHLKNDNR